MSRAVDAQAEHCHHLLRRRGETVGTAESLTGGSLSAALTAVAGASATFMGGVVAYTVPAKSALLAVPSEVLARHGPVHADTAAHMAKGARDALAATYGVATTGVAGPSPHGGEPVGTVFLACAGPAGVEVSRVALEGDRLAIRNGAVAAALTLLASVLDG